MNETELGTADRILLATLQLMQEKGFKSVSIKEIAQACQISEMTVFRHFETKKKILEEAVKRYSYIPSFKNLFDEEIVWELTIDLENIAHGYLDSMYRNKAVFLIAVQERTTMPELAELISYNTKELKTYIAQYFVNMQEQKKMVPSDSHLQAMIFLTMLYGYFSSTSLWGTQFIDEDRERFIRETISAFCKGWAL